MKLREHDEQLKSNENWYSRGYIPHFDSTYHPQMITYRLGDSLPQDVIRETQKQIKEDGKRRAWLEKYLDAGHGECWLRRDDCADIVIENLHHHDTNKYRLQEWVVMPNHVHVRYDKPTDLMKRILHSWRSYTANKINEAVGREGRLWQRGAFDRYIRDRRHFFYAQCYIWLNPVRAGLVDDPYDWPWSSIHQHEDMKPGIERWYKRWKQKFWLADMGPRGVRD
jgi:putative DNA methylase